MNSFYVSTATEEIHSLSGKIRNIYHTARDGSLLTFISIAADDRKSRDTCETYEETRQDASTVCSSSSNQEHSSRHVHSDLLAEVQELRARVAAQDAEIGQLIHAIRDDTTENGAHLAGEFCTDPISSNVDPAEHTN